MKTVLFALALLGGPAIAQSPMTITVDGRPVIFPGPRPRRTMGRVMVPLRGIFERLGALVRWDDDSQTVVATRKGHEVDLTIGDNNAVVDGKSVLMDVPAQLYQGSTYVPLRFVAQGLGARLQYDRETGAISIESNFKKDELPR